MAKQPSKTKMDELLGTIARTTVITSPSQTETSPSVPTLVADEPKTTRRTKSATKSPPTFAPVTAGKFSSIYLNPEDQRILRELSLWFSGQGRKINDTLIIRTALRAARTGSEFLTAYDEAAGSDRRYKRDKE